MVSLININNRINGILTDSNLKICQFVRILEVDYLHLRFENDDDLFLTQFGQPFLECLLPDNFIEGKWFNSHHQRLAGTSCVYKISTREVQGRSKEIVLKWNRMAQEVPGGTFLVGTLTEFNSPFEEFALVMEMRNSCGKGRHLLHTHKPLAIYVPAEKLEPWQLGRKEWVMNDKIRTHIDIDLDISRNYAMVYEWVKGMDAAMACQKGLIDSQKLEDLTYRVDLEMAQNGFMVSDRKPHHIIVRENERNQLIKGRTGEILYALIDFELLHRTEINETCVRRVKRSKYLSLQANRFHPLEPVHFPAHISPVNIFGVDYVFGYTESTKGALWVAGKDPELFDYFLPERWRTTPRSKISFGNQSFHTVTKDNINLVWTISRVGEMPDMDPFKQDEKQIIDYGYNSPFEEIALSLELSQKGILTTYPRAIYMTGHESGMPHYLLDKSRYQTHREIKMPDGKPILMEEREYVSVWGYWNGPDEMLAVRDGEYYKGIDALRAFREGLISEETYFSIMEKMRCRLFQIGIEDLNLRGSHLLLSLDPFGSLVYDSSGDIELRICQFELLKRIPS